MNRREAMTSLGRCCARALLPILMAGALVSAPVAAAFAGEAGYRLGPEDKVRLKVFEWRPSQDLVFEWKALNDEFTVNATGMLSIPLAGDVPVQGLQLEQVSRLVAERLRQHMGLSVPPDASVDIVQYRPFYVAGDVAHPGHFPYHPGLTVLEAVAIAGGVLRSGDPGLMRLGREVISGEGELTQFAQDTNAFRIREARLQAEVDGIDHIVLPPDLRRPLTGRGSEVLKAETTIFEARLLALRTQTEALTGLKAFLAKEVESIDAQLVTVDTQMQLINKELTSVTSLVDKGMAVAPRQLALERSVAQTQSDRLGMQTSKLRVQEEISKTDIALIQLTNSRSTDASIELRDTQLKLDDLAGKAETSERLLYEARITAPGLIAERLRKGALAPTYVIVRPRDGRAEDLAASDDMPMEPGDTVKVTVPLPSSATEDAEASAGTLPSPAVQ